MKFFVTALKLVTLIWADQSKRRGVSTVAVGGWVWRSIHGQEYFFPFSFFASYAKRKDVGHHTGTERWRAIASVCGGTGQI